MDVASLTTFLNSSETALSSESYTSHADCLFKQSTFEWAQINRISIIQSATFLIALSKFWVGFQDLEIRNFFSVVLTHWTLECNRRVTDTRVDARCLEAAFSAWGQFVWGLWGGCRAQRAPTSEFSCWLRLERDKCFGLVKQLPPEKSCFNLR